MVFDQFHATFLATNGLYKSYMRCAVHGLQAHQTNHLRIVDAVTRDYHNIAGCYRLYHNHCLASRLCLLIRGEIAELCLWLRATDFYSCMFDPGTHIAVRLHQYMFALLIFPGTYIHPRLTLLHQIILFGLPTDGIA